MGNYNNFIRKMAEEIYPKEEKEVKKDNKTKAKKDD